MIYREMTTAGGAATSAVRLLLNLVRECTSELYSKQGRNEPTHSRLPLDPWVIHEQTEHDVYICKWGCRVGSGEHGMQTESMYFNL